MLKNKMVESSNHLKNGAYPKSLMSRNFNPTDMKKFIAQNWYKLMIGTSLLMASFGFMIRSVTPAVAQATKGATTKTVPLGTDGTITVKLSQEQLDLLKPKKIQAVNIEQVYGGEAAAYAAYKDNNGYTHYSLGIDRDPW
jgi:hypothetical protein